MGRVEDRIIKDLMDLRKGVQERLSYHTNKAWEELRNVDKIDKLIDKMKHSIVTTKDDDPYTEDYEDYEDEEDDNNEHEDENEDAISGKAVDIEVCSTDSYGDKYDVNMKICIAPHLDLAFPYFKVYITNPITKGTTVTKFHFMRNGYGYGPIDPGRRDPSMWKISTSVGDQDLIRLLNEENVINNASITNWDYMKYIWNTNLGLMCNYNIFDYLRGDVDQYGKRKSRLYIPSDVKIPEILWGSYC